MTYRRYSLLLPPLCAVLCLVVMVGAGLNGGIATVAMIVVGLPAIACLPVAITNRIIVRDQRLVVRGARLFSADTSSYRPVHLDRITAAYTIHVSRHGVERRGGKRSVILEDALGGRQRIPLRYVLGGRRLKSELAGCIRTAGIPFDAELCAALGLSTASTRS